MEGGEVWSDNVLTDAMDKAQSQLTCKLQISITTLSTFVSDV